MGDETAAPERMLRAMVSGRVQGVGFRDWARNEARALGLEGWVRNRASGEVEAMFAGSAGAVALLCEKLWRGPPAAEVAGVDLFEAGADDLALRGPKSGFVRLPTA